MSLKIDTVAVHNAATQIDQLNQSISDDFNMLESRLNIMRQLWQGGAADLAMSRFSSIRQAYFDNRAQVLRDMVAFMNRQVGEEYEDMESKIAALADAFK